MGMFSDKNYRDVSVADFEKLADEIQVDGANFKTIEQLSRVRVKPGDLLVVMLEPEPYLTRNIRAALENQFKERLPEGVRVLVINHQATFQIIESEPGMAETESGKPQT